MSSFQTIYSINYDWTLVAYFFYLSFCWKLIDLSYELTPFWEFLIWALHPKSHGFEPADKKKFNPSYMLWWTSKHQCIKIFFLYVLSFEFVKPFVKRGMKVPVRSSCTKWCGVHFLDNFCMCARHISIVQ